MVEARQELDLFEKLNWINSNHEKRYALELARNFSRLFSLDNENVKDTKLITIRKTEKNKRESCYINKYLFYGCPHKKPTKDEIFILFPSLLSRFLRVDDNKNVNKLGNLVWIMVHFQGPASPIITNWLS